MQRRQRIQLKIENDGGSKLRRYVPEGTKRIKEEKFPTSAYGAFSYDVTAARLAAMLVYQAIPPGVKLFLPKQWQCLG